MEYKVQLPFGSNIDKYEAGDILYLSGTMYTARDAAHKRMWDAIREYCSLNGLDEDCPQISAGELFEKGVIPINLEDAIVYYLGPTPAAPGHVIGSAGPTTSGRMDKYTPLLLNLGMKSMIGKGRRSEQVREAIEKNHAIYLGATGGAGALLSKCIKKAEVIAYEDLGTEAIRELYVEEFPVTVLIDSEGKVYK